MTGISPGSRACSGFPVNPTIPALFQLRNNLYLGADKLQKSTVSFDNRNERNIHQAFTALDPDKRLNMQTVAEGVEDQAHVDFLASEGCNMIQGYFYAKPMPKEEYEQRISSEAQQTASEAVSEAQEAGVVMPEAGVETPASTVETQASTVETPAAAQAEEGAPIDTATESTPADNATAISPVDAAPESSTVDAAPENSPVDVPPVE